MNITSEDDEITILFDMKSAHKLYHICGNNSCKFKSKISIPQDEFLDHLYLVLTAT